ncbi:hypothetical protein AWM70_00640 [Paenibacillus yonginensis]|uniref:AraC family transcriptional regulator n=1 Tax=Paenibacillus yonginensis TaxID=1462996 RepID=A0A1B1MVR1_9BACL|nr:response regulator [Paenibacillus yonginensis]ANS73270.1 hypothetical protein AWM70_00640 [Paenibacillus yonginensis]
MYRVLIVDDELIVRHAVQTLIRWETGRFVHAGSCASGQAALDAVRQAGPSGVDIIITDIKMPDMDGLQLIKQLKHIPFDGEVLVLSNYNDFELVREALKQGAYDYMLKLSLEKDNFMEVLHEIADKLDNKVHMPSRAGSASRGGYQANREDNLVAGSAAAAGWAADSMESVGSTGAAGTAGLVGTSGSTGAAGSAGPAEGLGYAAAATAAYEANETYEANRALFPDWLQKVAQAAGEAEGSPLRSPAAGGPAPSPPGCRPGEQVLLFLAVAAPAPSLSREEASRLEPAWVSLLGELCPGSACKAAIKLGLGEWLLAVTGSQGGEAGELIVPEHLANRIASLTHMYYNLQTGMVYTDGADTIQELVQQLRQCRSLKSRLLAEARSFPVVWPASSAASVSAPSVPLWPEIEPPRELSNESAINDRAPLKIPMPGPSLSLRSASLRPEIAHVLDYLHQHYAERIVLPEVAAYVNLSEAYLCQLFKTETGQSILTYLNEFRMAKAYELLATGRYLVKEAAAEVGIHDPYYFNRLFKRKFGISPKKIKPQTS